MHSSGPLAQVSITYLKIHLALETALNTFYENKDVFIWEGVHEHFNIPKIHQMQHYMEVIWSHSTADGYNTEASERLHIDYAKEGYHASNKKDYIKQIGCNMGHTMVFFSHTTPVTTPYPQVW